MLSVLTLLLVAVATSYDPYVSHAGHPYVSHAGHPYVSHAGHENPFAGAVTEELEEARHKARERLVQGNKKRLRREEEQAQQEQPEDDENDQREEKRGPSRQQALVARCSDQLHMRILPEMIRRAESLAHRLGRWMKAIQSLQSAGKDTRNSIKKMKQIKSNVNRINQLISPLRAIPKIGASLNRVRLKAVLPLNRLLNRLLKPIVKLERKVKLSSSPMNQVLISATRAQRELLEVRLRARTFVADLKVLAKVGKCEKHEARNVIIAAKRILGKLRHLERFSAPRKVSRLLKVVKVAQQMNQPLVKIRRVLNKLKKLLRRRISLSIPSKRRKWISGKIVEVPYVKRVRWKMKTVLQKMNRLPKLQKVLQKTVVRPILGVVTPIRKQIHRVLKAIRRNVSKLVSPITKMGNHLLRVSGRAKLLKHLLLALQLPAFAKLMRIA